MCVYVCACVADCVCVSLRVIVLCFSFVQFAMDCIVIYLV